MSEGVALSAQLQDKATLHGAYMPMVQGGALFIPTEKAFELGQSVQLTLTLMEEPEPFLISTKVVWLTPKRAQSGRVAGVGLQLQGDVGEAVQRRIETFLAGSEKSDRGTHTM